MRNEDHAELPKNLHSGRLEGISIPDLLWAVGQSHKTGVLHVLHDSVERAIYISEGRLTFATSTDPDDRLGEHLLRAGLISVDQLDRAVARLDSGKRIGTLLVEMGAISPQDLVDGVIEHIRRIIVSLFAIEEGEYWFEEGELPSAEVITLEMKTAEITLEGIRQVRSFSKIRRSVGPRRPVTHCPESEEPKKEARKCCFSRDGLGSHGLRPD